MQNSSVPLQAQGWADALDAIAAALGESGGAGWIVGGCLRDALLGLPVGDVDLAVTPDPRALAAILRQRYPVTIAQLNRKGRVRLGLHVSGPHGPRTAPIQIDLSLLDGATLADDLGRRDFRINALALPLADRSLFLALLATEQPLTSRATIRAALPTLVDPSGGLDDLERRSVVPASEHALRDDPGRILRAARMIARFRFTASAALRRLATEAAPLLPTLPADRQRDELNALLAQPRAAVGLRLLAETGALAVFLPHLAGSGAIPVAIAAVGVTTTLQGAPGGTTAPATPTLASLDALRAWYAAPLPDGLPRIVALRWGLLHAEPATEACGEPPPDAPARAADAPLDGPPLAGPELRIVRAIAGQMQAAQALLRAGEPGELEVRALRRFFGATGEAGVDALTAAAASIVAQATAERLPRDVAIAAITRASAALDLFFRERALLIPPPLLSGSDLIRALGVAPGAEIGRLLAAVRAAQLDGAISTQDEALALARSLQ